MLIKKNIYNYFIISIILLISLNLKAQNSNFQTPTTGPISGKLLIIGGHASDSIFLEYFAELSGGKNSKIVIIPTARNDNELAKDTNFNNLANRFLDFGFTNINILHTRNKRKANNPNFTESLTKAKGVWIQGGRQWRLADAYLNTLTHLDLISVLHRGGVIAGTSAGATIQGSLLVRGDTKDNTIFLGNHTKGFGFIKNIAIDQHLLARNRQFDMFEVFTKYPHILGIGIDENTGIIVSGNEFKVIGNSYVAIYDNTRWSAEKDTIIKLPKKNKEFYFLKKGDIYNMKKRQIINYQN